MVLILQSNLSVARWLRSPSFRNLLAKDGEPAEHATKLQLHRLCLELQVLQTHQDTAGRSAG